jgi:hypothetical protein
MAKRITKKNHFLTSKSKFPFLYIFVTPKNDMTQNGETQPYKQCTMTYTSSCICKINKNDKKNHEKKPLFDIKILISIFEKFSHTQKMTWHKNAINPPYKQCTMIYTASCICKINKNNKKNHKKKHFLTSKSKFSFL